MTSAASMTADWRDRAVLDELIEGETYIYTGLFPKGAAGHRYKLHRLVLDVPSYQRKVLVEALSGKDKGLWFVCSINNFSRRYRQATPDER